MRRERHDCFTCFALLYWSSKSWGRDRYRTNRSESPRFPTSGHALLSGNLQSPDRTDEVVEGEESFVVSCPFLTGEGRM